MMVYFIVIQKYQNYKNYKIIGNRDSTKKPQCFISIATPLQKGYTEITIQLEKIECTESIMIFKW